MVFMVRDFVSKKKNDNEKKKKSFQIRRNYKVLW